MTPDVIEASQSSAAVQLISGSLIVICLLIAVLSQIATGATQGALRFNWQQVLMRFFAVIILIQGAGMIQGTIWSMGQSLGDQLLPGPSIAEIHGSLKERIDRLKVAREAQETEVESNGDWTDNITKALSSWVGNFIVYGVEAFCVTLIFINYHWLHSLQGVFMALLAAMAPLLFPASIIPGVNSWSHWLKLVISIALWPVIAGFLIKAHIATMGDFIAGDSVFTGDPNNLFLNLDTLGLLAEAVFFMLIMFSTPALSVTLVYGSATAFANGAGLLLSAPAIARVGMGVGSKVLAAGGGLIVGKGLRSAVPRAFSAAQKFHPRTESVSSSQMSAGSPPASARYLRGRK